MHHTISLIAALFVAILLLLLSGILPPVHVAGREVPPQWRRIIVGDYEIMKLINGAVRVRTPYRSCLLLLGQKTQRHIFCHRRLAWPPYRN